MQMFMVHIQMQTFMVRIWMWWNLNSCIRMPDIWMTFAFVNKPAPHWPCDGMEHQGAGFLDVGDEHGVVSATEFRHSDATLPVWSVGAEVHVSRQPVDGKPPWVRNVWSIQQQQGEWWTLLKWTVSISFQTPFAKI